MKQSSVSAAIEVQRELAMGYPGEVWDARAERYLTSEEASRLRWMARWALVAVCVFERFEIREGF